MSSRNGWEPVEQATRLNQLGQCLAGVFQNRQQALEAPAWFVHLKLWSYPVALFTDDSFTFFIEQASAAFSQPPYRQRLLRVRWSSPDATSGAASSHLTAEYYALKQPQLFQGAAQAPARLQSLKEDDLCPLVGGRLQVVPHQQPNAVRFEARPYPGERCQFEVDGKPVIIELAFDAIAQASQAGAQDLFLMYDKGIAPDTGTATWGALNGPFRLEKVEDLRSAILPQCIS